MFGIIISGEKDGTQLRNIRYGLINIDNSKGEHRLLNKVRQG
jgi:hypothetical protein